MITGFPSPAQGYEDSLIDMNRLFLKHPAATVYMKIDSSAYTRAGIFPGDLLVVDRAMDFTGNKIVVFACNGEFHIGRLSKIKSQVQVVGVVTYIIHDALNF